MKKAIIVDVDGTIAIRNPEGQQLDIRGNDKVRSIHDYSRVSEDRPMWSIISLINDWVQMHPSITVIITTGRPDSCREDTTEWLKNYLPFDELYMRVTGDNRADDIVKQEIYDANIRENYEVLYAFDDRDRVVAMWRANGIVCLQVANGNF